jgi:hypothetical protein
MSELEIWREVIRRALRDLCEPDAGLRNETVEWIRDGKGEDFLAACSDADLEPSAVAKLARRILALGPDRGKVYLTQVMEVTEGDRDQRTID